MDFSEPAYELEFPKLNNYSANSFRYGFSSLARPYAIFEFDVKTKQQYEVFRPPVPDFDETKYETRYTYAKAQDGTLIPISLLIPRGIKLDGKNPVLMRGYGAYGLSEEASFDPTLFSLVDRGFVIAIAHVRGGADMGAEWYRKGHLEYKMNSFTDFIACAEHMIELGYTSPKHLYATGASAGGLLMGGVLNMRPDLFNGVIAEVPFVDVMTTMLDESLPLTTGEYSEWGNPHIKSDYHRMLAYSPYDNIEAKAYPHLLVTTGYHDSQVQYWEPAKWVAKLRELKTDDNLLLFHTDMNTGHSGSSGRFSVLKDQAFNYSFLLKLEGYPPPLKK